MSITVKADNHFVSGYENKQDVVVTIANPKEKVFISNCTKSVITVKGKCAAVAADKLTGCGVIFDDVIGGFEAVNCSKLQVQANGALPRIQLDKITGASVYLQTADSQKADVVTALSTEVNVVIPGKTEDDDAIELPVPEQFVTTYADGKLITKAADHV